MKEVMPGIYQIEVPLPGSPLKILNSYLIKGKNDHLLVDVGYNTDAGEAALRSAFDELGIRLEDTRIFLTHLHADHSGLVERLAPIVKEIYVSQRDGDIINENSDDSHWRSLVDAQVNMGTPPDKMLAPQDHPAYGDGMQSPLVFTPVAAGDTVAAGPYSFTVVDLKGHTPGQVGLYEKYYKLLIAGDHILAKITPNINTWDFQADYLGQFLDSLKRIRQLDLNLVLPGHRALITDHKARIDELLAHHDRRLSQIRHLLATGEKTIYQLAHGVKWDFGSGDYANFPNEQKWFAGNEVFAHLEHLQAIGDVDYEERDGVYYYHLV